MLGRWRDRLIGSHLMIDESVAFALAQPDRRRRAAYWLTGSCCSPCGRSAPSPGCWLGGVGGDPARYGLDAAFPAALLALLLPRLRDPAALRVGWSARRSRSRATFVLPAGLPVLLALLGLVAALPVRRRRPRRGGLRSVAR